MGLVADLLALVATATADEPVRVALVGVGGSGKSELLEILDAEPGVEVIDDAHLLTDPELREVKARVRDPKTRSLFVAHRPDLDRMELVELDHLVSERGRVVVMPPLDIGEARRRAKSRHDLDIDAAAACRALELSAGRPALFDLVLADADPHQISAAVARLGGEALAVARALSTDPQLAPATLATVTGVSADMLASIGRLLDNEGFMDNDGLVPVVADALRASLDDVSRRVLHESIAEELIEVEAAPPHVARHLRGAKATGSTAAAWFVRAAEVSLPASPADAEGWVSEAVRAGASETDIAAVAAVAAAWLDRPLDAIFRQPSSALASLAAASAYARLGQWQQVSTIAATIGTGSSLMQWASAMTGTPSVGATGAGPIDRFVDAFGRSVRGDTSAVTEIVRAAPLAAAAFTEIPLPDEPVAVAALVSCTHNRFEVARRLLESSGQATNREQLTAAWIGLRSGSWRLANEALTELDGHVLHPRDQLYADATRVALARRTGEIDGLTHALNRALATLEMIDVDLLAIEPAAEIAVAASRLGRSKEVASTVDELCACARAAGIANAWLMMLRWFGLEMAIAAADDASIRSSAAEVGEVADSAPEWLPIGRAASIWADVSEDHIDEPAVEEAIDGLVSLDWRWEASTLAGAAAIRSTDPLVARRLLERARTLKPVAPDVAGVGSNVDSPLTARETEIASLVVDGATYREIGSQLFISPKTVEHHVARIRQKLGATSRAEMLTALRGLV